MTFPPRSPLLVAAAAGALVVVPLGSAGAGQLDRTFDRDGKAVVDVGAVDFAEDVAVQRDGKIVVAGWRYEEGAASSGVVARLAANGSLDRGFGAGGKVVSDLRAAYAVAVQRDGKIVLVGQGGATGQDLDFALARYNAGGSLDRTFGRDGRVTTDFGFNDSANGVAIQADGKIVVVGSARRLAFGESDFAAARYLPNGSLDATFDGDGRVTTSFTSASDVAADVALQRDGKIVVGGFAGWRPPALAAAPDFALARYRADGTLDPRFDDDGRVLTAVGYERGYVNALALQADGKILLAGGAVVRYRADGEVDSTFGERGKVSFAKVNLVAVTVQRDAKVLAAGTSERAEGDFAVVRLRRDGRLDRRFAGEGSVVTDFGGNSDDGASAAALQRDGKLVVAGATSSAPNAFDFALARYAGDAACVVPNVRGATLRVARARLVRARCSLGRVTRKASARVASGRVISQRPKPGTRLVERARVSVVVSRGRR